MLHASSTVPEAFGPVRIDGRVYVDGFLRDNTPIQPILENHPNITTIVVVFLKDKEHLNTKLNTKLRNRIRNMGEKAGVCLIEIIPTKNISGILGVQAANVSTDRVKALIKLGCDDTRYVLRKVGLARTISSGR